MRTSRRAIEKVVGVEDARQLARRVLDGGAEDEVTLRRNTDAFRELYFKPRMGVWIPEPSVGTTLFGVKLDVPVLTAPCGGLRMIHPEGDVGAAKGAAAAGTVHVASSASGFSMEEIASVPGPQWFQLYRYGGQDGMEAFIHRAQAAGYGALVVTIDTNVGGKREKDLRNGFNFSMRVNLESARRLAPQLITRPRWLAGYVRDGMPFDIANTAGMTANGRPLVLSNMARSSSVSTSPSWEDLPWIRNEWQGPLLVKGILTVEDAKRARDVGCDGIVISNHGGRQLEGAQATIDVLPEIAAAVGNELEVLLDSGVRRGGDVLKAIALGAKAVLVGRPYVWGLAIAGDDGVAHVLNLLRAEMCKTMQLMGCGSIADLDHNWLLPRVRANDYSRL
jgi:L-lactate dehydrogenase (cytochrome)